MFKLADILKASPISTSALSDGTSPPILGRFLILPLVVVFLILFFANCHIKGMFFNNMALLYLYRFYILLRSQEKVTIFWRTGSAIFTENGYYSLLPRYYYYLGYFDKGV